MSTLTENFYLGTSGLLLPVPNKLHYPEKFQDKSRLHYYSSLNNSIEINSSFYKIPRGKTVLKWAKEVPENFRFTFKVFKEITHLKQLAFSAEDVKSFMDVVANVGNKKGSLLIQFPPSIDIKYLNQIDRILAEFRINDSKKQWDFAVEFRHRSLYCEECYDVLERNAMTMVLHDKAKVKCPIITQGEDFVYLRFHGPLGDYRGTYDDTTLAEYAMLIAEWLEMDKRVYVYFNNTMGNVYANLRTLREMVI